MTTQTTQSSNPHSTVCVYCHRKLSDPESIDRGCGPVCAKRYGDTTQAWLFNPDQHEEVFVLTDGRFVEAGVPARVE